MKQRKCKVCKDLFEPQRGLQQTCNFHCALKLAKEIERKADKKKWQGEKKVMKEKLKTLSDWKKDLEVLVNGIVRLIDNEQSCISCPPTTPIQKGFAGHFHSVGSNDSLRFNLFNIFRQCYSCNGNKGGAPIQYLAGLVRLYGEEYANYVHYDIVRLYPSIHLSVPEIKGAITVCRGIIRELENKNYVYDAETRISLRKLYNEQIGIYK